jgi:ABC-type microcin C transport system permease subunit YejE
MLFFLVPAHFLTSLGVVSPIFLISFVNFPAFVYYSLLPSSLSSAVAYLPFIFSFAELTLVVLS